jgi:hypothetical protein
VTERALARRPLAPRLRTAVDTPVVVSAAVGGLLLAAFVARVLLARHVSAPWIMPDELVYSETSRGFQASGHFLFRDQPEALRTIYPALISPAWFAGSTHTAYTLVKVINVALMTLGAIPVYLWARRLVAPAWSVLAVVLYLSIPGFMYSAEILTENAFLPATMLALFTMALALERPSVVRQLLALGAIALATACRLQGVVFLLVWPTAIGLSLLFDSVAAAAGERRAAVRARLSRFWPSLGLLAVAVLAYVVFEVGRGRSVWSGAGVYRQVSSAHYAIRPALHWIVYHLGELTLSVGLIPVSALIVLFGLACRRATAPSPAERAFLAVASASVFWVVIQIGTFASHFSLRIEERYMFELGPVLLLALVVWLGRDLPRPAALTSAAVLAPTAFLVALPYTSFFNQSLFNDTFGLIPLWRLSTRLGTNAGELPVLVAAGALLAGLLFATVRRSWSRIAIPVAMVGFLILSSGSVFATITWLSNATRHAGGLAGDPSWIDDAVGKNARVDIVYTNDIVDSHVAWQAEFWNRSVHRILGVTGQDPSRPDLAVPIDPASGRLLVPVPAGSPDLHPAFVAAARGVDVVGTRVAEAGQLVLWRVRQPLRLRSLSFGITPDGWTGATAAYNRYVVPAGAHEIVLRLSRSGLSGLPAATVHVTLGRLARTVTVPGDGTTVVRLPLRRTPFQIRLSVSPTFSPSQFGSPDTRTLGVRASFGVR